MEKILNMMVCEGRHNIPQAIDGSCFPKEIPSKILKNPKLLEDMAFGRIWNACYRKTKEGEPMLDENDRIFFGIKLNLYVTGLTVAVISAIKAAQNEGMDVVLWHFDKDSESYYPQKI